MNERKDFGRIDIFRIAAAVMVVAIHTYPFADVSRTLDFVFTHVICRVAVPFFFMTSGFFLISHYAENGKKLTEFVKKTLIIYAVSIAVYIPINIYSGYFGGDTNFLQDIIFNGTMYHLWYLPASVMGACIAWFLVRRLDYGWAIAISAVLYALGLLGDSYYGVAESVGVLKTVYDALFRVFEYTRNGLFFAPIFFVLGGFAAEKRCYGKGAEKLLFVLFLDLMIGEGLLLNMFGNQRHDSMYIFLVPAVWYLFMLLLKGESRRRKTLTRAALVMYIVHPMVIVGVRLAGKIFGLEGLLVENNLVHFLAVTVISAIFAILWAELIPSRRKEKHLRAWKEIDLSALRHNAQALQGMCRSGCELMAVVKADAYGHGAYDVSVCLEKSGVNAFAVATIDEGIDLRKSGIRSDILILGYTEHKRAGELRKYRLTQTVVSYEHAKALDNENKAIDVHIKIDTGMHRLGFDAGDIEGIMKCFEMKNLNVTGVFSHLCVSDESSVESDSFTRGQISAFKRVVGEIKKNNATDIKTHLQSSYGLLNYPDIECDYVRAGIALYGVYSSEHDMPRHEADILPVLKLKAKVVQLKSLASGETAGYGRCYRAEKPVTIADVSIGYADGVPRNFCGDVMINGKAAPVVGRICMDQLSVDVTDIPDASVGDTVTLIGDGVTAEMMAENTATITNELLSRMGKRLETVIK
ncbi:MAG: serine racemase VanT catalytic subunit [Oscillospiraceae bacterium]|nr:serine racemase VanT catalytic subunit [Oscillospiraceae bacterium]